MMLKVHKPNRKLLVVSITSILCIGGLLGLQALTYTPELSHAETVTNKKTIDDITYMQEMTPEICQTATLNQQYTLTDIRDGKNYTIAKIKNRTNNATNCWMTQNLNIINKAISHTDSDMSSGSFTVPPSNISGFANSNQDNPKAYSDATYGGYYNWYTATAGAGASSLSSGNVLSSICPKGWRMPTGNTNGELYELLSGLSVARITATPYNHTYSGRVQDDTLYLTGDGGYYWSSSIRNVSEAHILSFNTTTVNPSSSFYRYYGLSIRCLARTESIPNDNIEITVNNTISLDTASEVEVEKTETNPSTANLDVKVASNQPYKVQINATNPTLTSSTTSTTIPSRAGALNTAVNGWGVKLSTASTYSQITSTPTTFYTATGAEVKTMPFTIGISTAPDLPNGEYSTDITVTAVQN